jgi:hypothetical protein
MSARNTKNVALFMKNDFIDEYTKRKGRLSKQNTVVSNYAGSGRHSIGISIDEVMAVRNGDELKCLETRF